MPAWSGAREKARGGREEVHTRRSERITRRASEHRGPRQAENVPFARHTRRRLWSNSLVRAFPPTYLAYLPTYLAASHDRTVLVSERGKAWLPVHSISVRSKDRGVLP